MTNNGRAVRARIARKNARECRAPRLLAGPGETIGMAGPHTKIIPAHGPIVDRNAVIAQRDLVLAMRDRMLPLIRE